MTEVSLVHDLPLPRGDPLRFDEAVAVAAAGPAPAIASAAARTPLQHGRRVQLGGQEELGHLALHVGHAATAPR